MRTIATQVQTTQPGATARETGVVRGGRSDPENRPAESRGELPRDLVSVSTSARRLFAAERDERPGEGRGEEEAQGGTRSEGSASDARETGGSEELSREERAEVAELERRDAEVRAHEQAHLAALGGEGGHASYSYTTGPDGKRYATGGEVPVSISAVRGDPDATIQRARRIVRAALAPANPSAADFQAAAKARQLEGEARRERQQEGDARGPEAPDERPVRLEASFGVGAGGKLEVDHLHPAGASCPHCGPGAGGAGDPSAAAPR